MVDIKSENNECLEELGDLRAIDTQELFQYIGEAGEINSEMLSQFDIGGYNPEIKAEYFNHLDRYPILDRIDSDFQFDVDLLSIKSGKNSWMYSSRLDKVFIKMNQTFTVDISYVPHDERLYLRAMLVYSTSEDIHNPVYRCHNHENQAENGNFPSAPNRVSHILRCQRPDTVYHGEKLGVLFKDRLAAIIPLGKCPLKPNEPKITESINFEFVCQNSCATGINRRSTVIIFTLEKENQEIIGKRFLSFKVCSAPKRDKEKEEGIDREKSSDVKTENKRSDPFEKKPSKKVAICSEFKREIQSPALLSPQNSSESLDLINSSMNGGKCIRLELFLPVQSVQHVLRCAFNDVSGRMALDKGLKNEEYTPYLKHIKKQMDHFNVQPPQ